MTPKLLLKKLVERSFLTGSYAFNLDNPQDVDHVILYEKWNEVIDDPVDSGMTYGSSYSEDDSFHSFNLKVGEETHNFIVIFSKSDWKEWRNATRWMKKLPTKLIETKEARVRIFELLRELSGRGKI